MPSTVYNIIQRHTRLDRACMYKYVSPYVRLSPYPHSSYLSLHFNMRDLFCTYPHTLTAQQRTAEPQNYFYVQLIEKCHIIFWRHSGSKMFLSRTSLTWARAGARNRDLFPTLLGDVVPKAICLKCIRSNLRIGVRIVEHLCSFLTSLDLKAKWYMHQKRWTR